MHAMHSLEKKGTVLQKETASAIFHNEKNCDLTGTQKKCDGNITT